MRPCSQCRSIAGFGASVAVLIGGVVTVAKGGTRGGSYAFTTFGAVVSLFKFVRFTPITTALRAPIEPPNPECPQQIAEGSGLLDAFGDAITGVLIVVNTIVIEGESPRPALAPPSAPA